MTLQELDNLVKIKQLKREAFNPNELTGLLHSAIARFERCKELSLSVESRFDLAYNASHALSLAALRKMGFRSENRYTFFKAYRTHCSCLLPIGVYWQPATSGVMLPNTKAPLRLGISAHGNEPRTQLFEIFE